MESTGGKNDLPLMANSNEIQIVHFIQDLKCDFNRKTFHGDIYLMLLDPYACGFAQRFNMHEQITPGVCEKLNKEEEIDLNLSTDIINCENEIYESASTNCTKHSLENSFVVKLDSHDIHYNSVEEIEPESPIKDKLYNIYKNSTACQGYAGSIIDDLRTISGRELKFVTDTWCLQIWKAGVTSSKHFPHLVRISYETKPDGASLRWTKDQDGNPCVYTSAMWVNNRTFLPCQEYGSFSTWQAAVTVDEDFVVLMSGETDPVIQHQTDGRKRFIYSSSMPLPSFTLALAVGKWACVSSNQPGQNVIRAPTCHHSPACRIPFSDSQSLPWRIFGPESLIQKAVAEFSQYLDKSTAVIQELLGPSPFPRVDVLIYPDCSQDMAMANPSLIFLSQSMLTGEGSMCIKLGHELSHYWFGLLIGAKDWTEEWLSEGFATFVEDVIHTRVQGWDAARLKDFSELRSVLRLRNLKAELENTKEELQKLRPNEGNELEKKGKTLTYIKDGMNPHKQFTQLHYLKGYFLLRHLSSAAGMDNFLRVLKEYIVQYHGCMVLSQEFISFVFEKLPELRDSGFEEAALLKDWLDTPGLPKVLVNYEKKMENVLYKDTVSEAGKWIRHDKQRRKRKRGKRKNSDECFISLETEQQVLLLEELLKETRLTCGTLNLLKETYSISLEGNPDVGHRWCELVIKHKYTKYYPDVKYFLIHHQAMGVYLYGELIISRCSKQKSLAEECYRLTSDRMERGTRNSVHTMVYGQPYSEDTS